MHLEATYGLRSPLLFVIFFILLSMFPYTSPSHTFFSTHLSRCQKPLKRPMGNIKINLQSPPFNPQQPPESQQQPSCLTDYAERTGNILVTGWIWQRHLNIKSDSCSPKLVCEMLSLEFNLEFSYFHGFSWSCYW